MSIYSAKEPFTFDDNGVPRFFSRGDLISSDDPGFEGREHLFEPVSVTAARRASATETATADPEPRGRGRRPKKPEPETATTTDTPEGGTPDA